MGCDIHAHFEIKINGKWLHWSQPNIGRNYKVFAKMANIRNDGTIIPLSKPRGLPDDITETTRIHANNWGIDGHSHSWLNSYEIGLVIKFHESQVEEKERYRIEHYQWGYLFGNSWTSFHKYRNEYLPEIDEFRLVFWFDN